MVLGPGTFTGGYDGEVTWGAYHLTLTDKASSIDGRYLAEASEGAPIGAPPHEWSWSASTSDSLDVLVKVHWCCGFRFKGQWTNDSILARARWSTDRIGSTSARANAYGVRYECGDQTAADVAMATVESLRIADVPDLVLSAREDSVAQAEMRASRERMKNRPPLAIGDSVRFELNLDFGLTQWTGIVREIKNPRNCLFVQGGPEGPSDLMGIAMPISERFLVEVLAPRAHHARGEKLLEHGIECVEIHPSALPMYLNQGLGEEAHPEGP